VKIGRRLQSLGAVAVKNSVYVLPWSEQTLEDLQWVRKEIVAGGGKASVCEARFVKGLSAREVGALFNEAREADYRALAREVRRAQGAAGRGKGGLAMKAESAASLGRLRKRLGEVVAIDFFGAKGRATVERGLDAIEAGLRPPPIATERGGRGLRSDVRGRTWVTRADVHVDRIASAWLIRRFIDAGARFKFVRGREYSPLAGELRFDMFEAEFTHEGELCTFEVLRRRFRLKQAALKAIAEIVHDIDLKDKRFGRAEAAGVDRLLAGMALKHPGDEARLREGAALFDSLFESFQGKR
jgi:hypothetical protein